MEKIKNILTEKKRIAHAHVDLKLLRRLQVFSVIIFIIFAIGLYRYIQGDITFFHALIGSILGTGIGFLAGRMFRIFWHEELEKVVSQLDRTGMIFLALYIGVEVGRNWLFGHWLHGAELSAFGIVFLGGLLLGRFLAMTTSIKKVLLEKKKI